MPATTPNGYPYAEPTDPLAQWPATSQQLAQKLDDVGVPIGTIVAFTGSATIPNSWKVCDGTNGTPDLRGRFILGASSTRPAGTGGGTEVETLTVAEMPNHSHGGNTAGGGGHQHTYSGGDMTGDQYGLTQSAFHTGKVVADLIDKSTYSADGSHGHGIQAEGGGEAHNNMPPYWALVYIMRVA